MSMDVTKAIEPRSDQQNADDYLAGPETVKIESVEIKSTSEQPVWIHLVGKKGKPFKPSKTALRCLALVWGPDASKWAGLSMTLYNDPDVTWAGMKVGGIRISHMEGLTEPRTLMLTKTRGKKAATVIKPLKVDNTPAADNTATQDAAREAAKKGKASFTDWWKSVDGNARDAVKPIMDELKRLSDEADSKEGEQ